MVVAGSGGVTMCHLSGVAGSGSEANVSRKWRMDWRYNQGLHLVIHKGLKGWD